MLPLLVYLYGVARDLRKGVAKREPRRQARQATCADKAGRGASVEPLLQHAQLWEHLGVPSSCIKDPVSSLLVIPYEMGPPVQEEVRLHFESLLLHGRQVDDGGRLRTLRQVETVGAKKAFDVLAREREPTRLDHVADDPHSGENRSAIVPQSKVHHPLNHALLQLVAAVEAQPEPKRPSELLELLFRDREVVDPTLAGLADVGISGRREEGLGEAIIGSPDTSPNRVTWIPGPVRYEPQFDRPILTAAEAPPCLIEFLKEAPAIALGLKERLRRILASMVNVVLHLEKLVGP